MSDLVEKVVNNIWNVVPSMCDETWAEAKAANDSEHKECVATYYRFAKAALAAIPSLTFDEAVEIGTQELLSHQYSEEQTDRELVKTITRALTANGDVLIRRE